MKIDYHYPELGLWVTLWVEKPGRSGAPWWTQKQKLKQDIFLAVIGALGPADVPDSAADAAEKAGPADVPGSTGDAAKRAVPADVPDSAADAAKKAESARMPERGDVIFGG